mmetsp:Transcript_35312/g.83765  ORF Transcript_35312/g.83765 Transcript_35312/m.83765 type:complete len:307 (+) Transcript_35312:3591-4511(+)
MGTSLDTRRRTRAGLMRRTRLRRSAASKNGRCILLSGPPIRGMKTKAAAKATLGRKRTRRRRSAAWRSVRGFSPNPRPEPLQTRTKRQKTRARTRATRAWAPTNQGGAQRSAHRRSCGWRGCAATTSSGRGGCLRSRRGGRGGRLRSGTPPVKPAPREPRTQAWRQAWRGARTASAAPAGPLAAPSILRRELGHPKTPPRPLSPRRQRFLRFSPAGLWSARRKTDTLAAETMRPRRPDPRGVPGTIRVPLPVDPSLRRTLSCPRETCLRARLTQRSWSCLMTTTAMTTSWTTMPITTTNLRETSCE